MTQQLLTPHQSQYVAWLLTRRAAGDSVESLASILVDSQVDLNPHQVDAALFACRNPLSRGVILADEVGLGKTIEAGLVISQRWAERTAEDFSSSSRPICASSGIRNCRTSSACKG
jgi:SNF2 family DNA or RNA helicase